MSNHPQNEHAAAIAFSRQAPVFDSLYGPDTIIQYKRQRVRAHVEKFLPPASRILELNSGTGEDAVYFAQQGHAVHATDISEGMQAALRGKVARHRLQDRVSTELCSFSNLPQLNQKGPYDLVFSNFAGLNCTGQLAQVLHDAAGLLKPGGLMTLVILPRFCIWETALILKGKFRTATRRFFSQNGRKAFVEGKPFTCWYYNPAFVQRELKGFTTLSLEALCLFVPPSYMEQYAEKHPALFRFLKRLEAKYKSTWPWRSLGDYYIITLKKE